MKLYRIFQRFAELQDDGRYTLHYSLSSKALMEMFGSQTALLASRLGSALPRPPSQGDEEAKRLKRAEGMTLREFLIWSRRLREAEVEWYRQEFERADVDHGGYLDEDEIRLVLQRVGYTPLRAVILDLIESVNPLKGNVMDFDEFVEMMEIFRTQNGFTRKEVQEFKQSFEMFDTDQSEEVDVIQVGGILRSLGISAELGQVQALVKTVDWNGSNSLDFNEFLRLMWLQREDELARVKVIFDAAADARVTDAGDVKVTIEPNQMISVFRKLGYPESVGKSTLDLFLKMIREPLDFDALVLLVDSCRRMNMQKMRKQASFTDDAVERFRLLFNSLDSDGSGEIDKRELVAFCKDRGLPLATKKDQEQLLNFINEARSTALRSGVSLADCGPEKSPAVKFWVFIHLQRILQTHQDKLRATELRSTAGNNFSQAEVDELSYVFAQGVAAESKRGDEEATLSLTGLWSVLDKLGVRLTPIEKEEVKVKLFMDAGNVLDLPAFIRVVGWLAAAKQSSANLSIKR